MDTEEEIEIIPGRCVVCDGPAEEDGGLLFCEFCPAVDDEARGGRLKLRGRGVEIGFSALPVELPPAEAERPGIEPGSLL